LRSNSRDWPGYSSLLINILGTEQRMVVFEKACGLPVTIGWTTPAAVAAG